MTAPERDAAVPRAFISYSWDDGTHKDWVKQLAIRLRTDGVDVTLDRWHAAPGDQIPAFMERAVRENDFVIAICTSRFKERSDRRGSGVGYEGDIMTAYAFNAEAEKKFIPVLRCGTWSEAAPTWLFGRAKIDLSGDPYSEPEYQELLRTLHGAREVAPPIGRRPDFGANQGPAAGPVTAPITPPAQSSTPRHQSSTTSHDFISDRRQGSAGVTGRIDDPVSSAEPVRALSAQVEAASRARRHITWSWVSVAAVPLLVLLGVVIYIVTDNGTAMVKGTDASMDVRIDNKKILSEKIGERITLHTGSHDLEVTRGDVVVTRQTFEIRRGRETPLQVTFQKPLEQILEWTNSIGIKFARIEAGEFLMGTTKEQMDQLIGLVPDSAREIFDNEQPQHAVKITRAFFLGKHEVTQGQYEAVTSSNPSLYKGSNDLPVEQVSWYDAVEFCNKLSERDRRKPFYRINGTEVTVVGGNGYRLPTEAEWEYACRAKSAALYPFGDEASKLGEHAWFGDNAEQRTHPVGQKLPNTWGLFDMLGNVWEWCSDGYAAKYYVSSPPADPMGRSEASHRVIRGSSWSDQPWGCRPANRLSNDMDYERSNLGFRVAAFEE